MNGYADELEVVAAVNTALMQELELRFGGAGGDNGMARSYTSQNYSCRAHEKKNSTRTWTPRTSRIPVLKKIANRHKYNRTYVYLMDNCSTDLGGVLE